MNETLSRYQNDPVAFASEVLGITTLTPKQVAILMSVQDNIRTAVRAANGAGKTFVAAIIVLWAVCCFRDTLVITTASTNRQVTQQLWGEVRRLYQKAAFPLGGEMLNTQLRFSKINSSALGFCTDDAGRFEGWHAKRVMVVIDEAKSVTPEIFDAVERVLSVGAWIRLLVISSPGGAIGPFFDIFRKQRHLYALHHITAHDAPHIRPEWIEERRREWGENSALFQSAVLGEFPTDGQDGTVIPLGHVLRLQENPPPPIGNELRAGIDLAADGGDESVMAIFRGNQLIALECWRQPDTMASVSRIIQLIRTFHSPPPNINVDADGLGKGVYDRLCEQGFRVVAVHNGGQATDKQQFFNFTTEAWVNCAQLIERGEIALISDDKLVAQLASRRLKPRSDGRVQLESKEDMRGRGLPSPDRADAVVLALVTSHGINTSSQLEVMKKVNEMLLSSHGESAASTAKWAFPGVKGVVQVGHIMPLQTYFG